MRFMGELIVVEKVIMEKSSFQAMVVQVVIEGETIPSLFEYITVSWVSKISVINLGEELRPPCWLEFGPRLPQTSL